MIQRFVLILLVPVLLIGCVNSHTTVSTPVAIGDLEPAFLAAYGPPPNSHSSTLERWVNGHDISFNFEAQRNPPGGDRVYYIELRVFTDNASGSDEVWSPDFEHSLVSTFFPSDATYVHDINPFGSIYHIYHSDSLATLVPASWFIHDSTLAPAGTFWWCRDETGHNSYCQMGLGDYGS